MEILGIDLPKRSGCVVANFYGALLDPNTFPEPKTFKPSRFLDDQGCIVNQSVHIGWGVGNYHFNGNLKGY